jgi:hypothetical protein
VKADADRLRRYAEGDLALICIGVDVFRHDIKLAGAGLYGIDVDSTDDPYLSDIAEELIAEALSEARANISKLCRGG